MTQGQLKFLFLVVAGILGIFFRIGLVGLGGLFLGIFIAILGPMAVAFYGIRARRRRNEQAMAVLALTLLKQAEGPQLKDKPGALGA